jgi:hypothetical protein
MARRAKNSAIVQTVLNPELGFADVLDVRKRSYLIDLAQSGGVVHAADAAKVSRVTIKNWRQNDADFAESETCARQKFVEKLEAEAIRRAVDGVDHGVYYKGCKVGDEKTYSDSLLATLLKGNAPDKYGDLLKIGGGGEPIKVMSLGINLDASEVHDAVDKILLSSATKGTREVGGNNDGQQPGGNGEGGVG